MHPNGVKEARRDVVVAHDVLERAELVAAQAAVRDVALEAHLAPGEEAVYMRYVLACAAHRFCQTGSAHLRPAHPVPQRRTGDALQDACRGCKEMLSARTGLEAMASYYCKQLLLSHCRSGALAVYRTSCGILKHDMFSAAQALLKDTDACAQHTPWSTLMLYSARPSSVK